MKLAYPIPNLPAIVNMIVNFCCTIVKLVCGSEVKLHSGRDRSGGLSLSPFSLGHSAHLGNSFGTMAGKKITAGVAVICVSPQIWVSPTHIPRDTCSPTLG